MGGPCDFGVTPVPTGLGFLTGLGLGLGLRGPDLGLGLDKNLKKRKIYFIINCGIELVITLPLVVLRC